MIFIFIILFNSLNNNSNYKIIHEIEPNHLDRGQAHINQAVEYLKNGDYNSAEREIESSLLFGYSREAKYLRGVVQYRKGNIEEARECFKELDDYQYCKFLYFLYGDFNSTNFYRMSEELIPDSLRFYYIFYENDRDNIKKYLSELKLPEWQEHLGLGYLSYIDGEFQQSLKHLYDSFEKKPLKQTGTYIISSLFSLSLYDSLLNFQKKYSINNELVRYIKGETFYKKGKYSKAMKFFLSDTVDKFKKHALYATGWSQYRRGEYSESAKYFKKFLNEYSGGKLRQFAIYRIARSLLKQGKIESTEYFKNLVNDYPDSPLIDDSYLLLGKINFLLNKYQVAISWFKKLIEDVPDSKWILYAYRYLGIIHFNREEFENAKEYFSKIINSEDAPGNLIEEIQYKMEEIRWKMGEYSSKINMYKGYINKYPENRRSPELLLRIGDYYNTASRIERATSVYNRILEKYPDKEESNIAFMKLVNLYQKANDKEKAISLLLEGLEKRENINQEINFKLGNIYYGMKQFRKAIKYLERVTSETLMPEARYKISLIYFELGLSKESRIPLRYIIENFKDSRFYVDSYTQLVKTHLQEGNFEKAIEIIEKGLQEMSEKDAYPLLNLKAEIYCSMGDEEAIDIYLKNAEMMGGNIEKAIESLKRARDCARKLNKTERSENIENMINALKTHRKTNP